MNILKSCNLSDYTSVMSAQLNEQYANKYGDFDDYNASYIKQAFFSRDYSQAFEALKSGIAIYRGDASLNGRKVIGVTPGTRTSQYTSNIYTSLFSCVLPSWKSFPRRDKSIICTNDDATAYNYASGNVFYVFPKNGAKIGICPTRDIWLSFEATLYKDYGLNDLKEFNDDVLKYISLLFDTDKRIVTKQFKTDNDDQIKEIFNNIEDETRRVINDTYLDFVDDKNINELDENIIDIGIEDFSAHIGQRYFNGVNFIETLIRKAYYGQLIPWLDEILTPKKNKFKIGSVFDIPNNTKNELWFSNHCIMISASYLEEIEDELLND